jgi:hypothetical protein
MVEFRESIKYVREEENELLSYLHGPTSFHAGRDPPLPT